MEKTSFPLRSPTNVNCSQDLGIKHFAFPRLQNSCNCFFPRLHLSHLVSLKSSDAVQDWDPSWTTKRTSEQSPLLPVFMGSMGSSGKVLLPRLDRAFHGFFLCPYFPTGRPGFWGLSEENLDTRFLIIQTRPFLWSDNFIHWFGMWLRQLYWVTQLYWETQYNWVLSIWYY